MSATPRTHAHPHGHGHAVSPPRVHDHDELHHHALGPRGGRSVRLLLGLALTLLVLLAEALGGWWSGSLALLADAGHMLVDALALGLALASAQLARRAASARYSYGLARAEVLAGFFNAITQFVLVAFIAVEALQRLWQPRPIASGVMLLIALIGLVANTLVLILLHRHDDDDLNMAAASLHVLGDLLGSVATVLAAAAVRWLHWLWADPVLSLLVSLLLLRSALVLVRRASHILLEGTPEGVDSAAMLTALRALDARIVDVHHLHVWQLAAGQRIATLHVQVRDAAAGAHILAQVQAALAERFGIAHATIQIESDQCADGDGGAAGCDHGH